MKTSPWNKQNKPVIAIKKPLVAASLLIPTVPVYVKPAINTAASLPIGMVNALLPKTAKRPYNRVIYGNSGKAQRMQMDALRARGVYEATDF